jgi:Pvc16 N-terminal domain
VSYLVISEVSEFLKHTIFLGLSADPITHQLIPNETDIVLTNPAQTAPQQASRLLSLWLYQILPNEHLRNQPFVRRSTAGPPANDDLQFYPPLALNLFYLITPSLQDAGIGNAKDQIADQQVLGRVMQVLYDQSVLYMPNKQAPDAAHELHLSLAPRTIEELAEVWEAMQQPYRLSVCYEVRAVSIDSERRLRGGRVMERRSDFTQLASV